MIEIEEEEGRNKKALEVCLAEDKGEEQDLIVWEGVVSRTMRGSLE